jgi:hypothetical protein
MGICALSYTDHVSCGFCSCISLGVYDCGLKCCILLLQKVMRGKSRRDV